jgi:hypothetical protein
MEKNLLFFLGSLRFAFNPAPTTATSLNLKPNQWIKMNESEKRGFITENISKNPEQQKVVIASM